MSASNVVLKPMPSPQEVAYFSYHAYTFGEKVAKGEKILSNELPLGWKLLAVFEPIHNSYGSSFFPCGYFAFAVINDKRDLVILSHRGTVWDFANGVRAVELLKGVMPAAQIYAEAFTKKVYEEAIKLNSDISYSQIYHTGHSSGASHGTVSAWQTGSPAIVFDPVGMKNIISKIVKGSDAKIITYLPLDNFINQLHDGVVGGAHFGEIRRIVLDKNTESYVNMLRTLEQAISKYSREDLLFSVGAGSSLGTVYLNYKIVSQTHSMEKMCKALGVDINTFGYGMTSKQNNLLQSDSIFLPPSYSTPSFTVVNQNLERDLKKHSGAQLEPQISGMIFSPLDILPTCISLKMDSSFKDLLRGGSVFLSDKTTDRTSAEKEKQLVLSNSVSDAGIDGINSLIGDTSRHSLRALSNSLSNPTSSDTLSSSSPFHLKRGELIYVPYSSNNFEVSFSVGPDVVFYLYRWITQSDIEKIKSGLNAKKSRQKELLGLCEKAINKILHSDRFSYLSKQESESLLFLDALYYAIKENNFKLAKEAFNQYNIYGRGELISNYLQNYSTFFSASVFDSQGLIARFQYSSLAFVASAFLSSDCKEIHKKIELAKIVASAEERFIGIQIINDFDSAEFSALHKATVKNHKSNGDYFLNKYSKQNLSKEKILAIGEVFYLCNRSPEQFFRDKKFSDFEVYFYAAMIRHTHGDVKNAYRTLLQCPFKNWFDFSQNDQGSLSVMRKAGLDNPNLTLDEKIELEKKISDCGDPKAFFNLAGLYERKSEESSQKNDKEHYTESSVRNLQLFLENAHDKKQFHLEMIQANIKLGLSYLETDVKKALEHFGRVNGLLNKCVELKTLDYKNFKISYFIALLMYHDFEKATRLGEELLGTQEILSDQQKEKVKKILGKLCFFDETYQTKVDVTHLVLDFISPFVLTALRNSMRNYSFCRTIITIGEHFYPILIDTIFSKLGSDWWPWEDREISLEEFSTNESKIEKLWLEKKQPYKKYFYAAKFIAPIVEVVAYYTGKPYLACICDTGILLFNVYDLYNTPSLAHGASITFMTLDRFEKVFLHFNMEVPENYYYHFFKNWLSSFGIFSMLSEKLPSFLQNLLPEQFASMSPEQYQYLAVGISAVAASFSAYCNTPNGQSNALRRNAELCAEKSHFDEAAKKVQEAIKISSTTSDVTEQLLLHYQCQDNFGKNNSYVVIKICSQYLEKHPNDDLALGYCGMAYLKMGDYSSALWYTEKAMHTLKGKELGTVEHDRGQLKKRLEMLRNQYKEIQKETWRSTTENTIGAVAGMFVHGMFRVSPRKTDVNFARNIFWKKNVTGISARSHQSKSVAAASSIFSENKRPTKDLIRFGSKTIPEPYPSHVHNPNLSFLPTKRR